MSELKVYAPYDYSHEPDRCPSLVYDKSDVDNVLEEKDEEIRRLHRALYKACANWAIFRARILEYFRIKINAKKWERMYLKCRAKMEKYK